MFSSLAATELLKATAITTFQILWPASQMRAQKRTAKSVTLQESLRHAAYDAICETPETQSICGGKPIYISCVMRHFTKRHHWTMTALNSGNSTKCSFSIRANVLWLLVLLPAVYHLLLEGSTKDESANGNCLHNANFAFSSLRKRPYFSV